MENNCEKRDKGKEKKKREKKAGKEESKKDGNPIDEKKTNLQKKSP
jgi:hypothetical protein